MNTANLLGQNEARKGRGRHFTVNVKERLPLKTYVYCYFRVQ